MKKMGMLTTLTLLAAGLLLSPTASANENPPDPRYQPPSDGFVLVTQLEWTQKDYLKDTIVVQQWESDAEDAYNIRWFEKEDGVLYATLGEYRRTYRGKKVAKPRPEFSMWSIDSTLSNPPPTFKPVFTPYIRPFDWTIDGDTFDGFDLRFARSALKAGKYTVLFSDRDLVPSQWKCSIYYKEVCYWKKGSNTLYWYAYLFDVKNRSITKMREKTGFADTAKQFQKQLTTMLKR